MSNEEKSMEYIRQYLLGNLTGAEHSAFEERLKDDSKFAKEVQFYKSAFKAVKIEKYNDRIYQFESIYDKYELKKRARVIKVRRILLIVVVVASILIIWNSWSNIFQPLGPVLFARYFEVDDSGKTERDAPVVGTSIVYIDSLWQLVEDFRETKDYGQLAQTLELIIETDKDPSFQTRYYLGMILLALKEPEPYRAIDTLGKVLNVDNDYHGSATWYLALAYLKTEQLEEAKIKLKEVIDMEHNKQKEAREILARLE